MVDICPQRSGVDHGASNNIQVRGNLNTVANLSSPCA
jgi:hypothetical protein